MTVIPTIPLRVLDALAELVERRSGMRFVEGRRAELGAKVTRVFAASGRPTWDGYLADVSDPANSTLLDQLVEALTIGETYFFRHRPYFEAIEREVLPAIIAQRQETRHLNVWSAGCASGEEAYSLAIVVRRLLPDLSDWLVSIRATDLNRASLERAEAGLYHDWSFRETGNDFTQAHFTREGNGYRIRPEVRRLVRFSPLNLVEGGYPSAANGTAQVDLLLCRNVLMYFAPEVIRQVVERLRSALAPGGWLVLGPSDPLPGMLSGFQMHALNGAILYQRVEQEVAAPIATPPVFPPWPAPPSFTPRADDRVATLPPIPPPAAMANDLQPEPSPDLADSVITPPGDWRQSLREAYLHANAGRVELAELACQQALDRSASRPEPYYLLGTLRQAAGDDERALASFRRALYVDREFAPAHLALAAIHRRAGRVDQARQALLRARRILAGRPDSEVILVDESLSVGRLRDALVQALDHEVRGGTR